MSQLVKTKLEVSFKDFKRFGAIKGLVEQKKTNIVFNSFVCKLGSLWHSLAHVFLFDEPLKKASNRLKSLKLA
jgi:hypothetical protein